MFSSGIIESPSRMMNFRFREEATSMAKKVANDSARSGPTRGKIEGTIVKMLQLPLMESGKYQSSASSIPRGIGEAVDSRLMNVARWDRVWKDAFRTCQQRILCLA
ncbi:hypothetical protein PanWU01x14_334630 [Parasponia andersonii]|uniref:Uncharacterized protein n=1 Tax=Parasponia andersonii TaxID=3476 RepID=A0A2P5AGG2_PARAD|nr:hypothetical protein PanWU01x14_334630 [Parasponia andersonii]